ncbi:transcription-repair coupling factor [Nisaea sp.]|uniref:transcription-repair coupling factor n=1 Tax=Nisaea sp. TaxID=2024842 RepID=UPI003266FFD2
MIYNKSVLADAGSAAFSSVPEGHDARVLLEVADAHGGVVHVARDDSRLAVLRQSLGFFAPEQTVLSMPAWDCLPYDRVSPHGDLISQRVETLARLASTGLSGGAVMLTTVNALLQRVPSRSFFTDVGLALKPGDSKPVEDIARFFEANGYTRAATVREAGEYAVRGGIIDVFPPGAEEPLRLDFFGDELETIRSFDPVSQRTTGKLDSFEIFPVGEFRLDEEGIKRFRSGYRTHFGGEISKDPLYEAVSEGRRHVGMEHWLSLFHEDLETLIDYTGSAPVTFDYQVDAAMSARFDLIQEYYEARKSLYVRGTPDGGSVYRPLPPDSLYLNERDWQSLEQSLPRARFTPFDLPESGADGATVLDCGGHGGVGFAEARARPDIDLYAAVRDRILDEPEDRRVLVAGYTSGSRDRLVSLLHEHGLERLQPVGSWEEVGKLPKGTAAAIVLPIEQGFASDDLLCIAEQDILGERLARPSIRRGRRGEEFLQEVSALNEGDYVVHVEHGIGQYDGLETLEIGGAPHDCLRLLYLGGDKLFVPVESIDVLSRYGSQESGGQLDKLGGAAWQARKARVKKRLRDMAEQLIRLAAEREVRETDPVPTPTGAYDEFCAKFSYTETDDQLRAIEETLNDLNKGRPMDRLVCGDVGFGKTEVALRAAMVVAMQGYQVAVVVPTTLLARQHFSQFVERFKGLPVKVRQLSRMVPAKDQTAIKEELANGDCSIVVGTHAVLAKSIRFSNLGMVIVDEEQHFGVAQKERLKELRSAIHVLTLTATPIPRTLQMALSGVRQMSLITTPPVDRLAVRTFVMPYDGLVIREAIMREHYRGGQTFYVCPRLDDLPRMHDRLTQLVPEVRIATAHGRMSPTELENVMTKFCDGAYDILLSTNIVESGLDIPNANTIIIHRSDMFGLAQLYQLRGRVGRSKTRAYAYLTTHPTKVLTADAKRRLEVMQTLDSLGAGFSLASHDMDIRGAGNLLGEEQSGQVKEVGIELYQHLLQEAVQAAREGGFESMEPEEQWTPQISLGTPVLIPENYVQDLTVRLSLYRRIANLVDEAEIDSFAAELADRFGTLPPEVENLLKIIAIKQLCKLAGVERVDAGPKGAVLTFRNNDFSNPRGLVGFIAKQAGSVQLRPDHKLVYRRAWEQKDVRVRGLTGLMQELVAIASQGG